MVLLEHSWMILLIDSLVFIDGTILDISDRANLTYEYYGTEENDNLRAYSSSNDSLLYGYGGNDSINTTNGNDQGACIF